MPSEAERRLREWLDTGGWSIADVPFDDVRDVLDELDAARDKEIDLLARLGRAERKIVDLQGEMEQARCRDCQMAEKRLREIEGRHETLRKAAWLLYTAGFWRAGGVTAQRATDLWEALRDAAGIEPGTATKLGMVGPPV